MNTYMNQQDRIEKIDHHLNIALSELNKLAGTSKCWIGSIGDLKSLVKAKLLICSVKKHSDNALRRATKNSK